MFKINDVLKTGAIEILTAVSEGKDTLDQQTAQYILDYIHSLKIVADARTDARDKEIETLKDQLHRRNTLIKKLRENKKKEYVSVSTCIMDNFIYPTQAKDHQALQYYVMKIEEILAEYNR